MVVFYRICGFLNLLVGVVYVDSAFRYEYSSPLDTVVILLHVLPVAAILASGVMLFIRRRNAILVGLVLAIAGYISLTGMNLILSLSTSFNFWLQWPQPLLLLVLNCIGLWIYERERESLETNERDSSRS